MLKHSLFTGSIILAALSSGIAFAGPVSDFENSLHAAYADYRQALFHTNADNQEKSIAAITAFSSKWAALSDNHKVAPPQYADDPDFAATLEKVAAIASEASAMAAADDVAKAHEKLEGVREEIGQLHERNGIISFSDRMNIYHAQMEKVLLADYKQFGPAEMDRLRDEAAILIFLAKSLLEHPAAKSPDKEFETLSAAVVQSAIDLHEAARAADGAAAKSVLSRIKPSYAKLFLKFG